MKDLDFSHEADLRAAAVGEVTGAVGGLVDKAAEDRTTARVGLVEAGLDFLASNAAVESFKPSEAVAGLAKDVLARLSEMSKRKAGKLEAKAVRVGQKKGRHKERVMAIEEKWAEREALQVKTVELAREAAVRGMAGHVVTREQALGRVGRGREMVEAARDDIVTWYSEARIVANSRREATLTTRSERYGKLGNMLRKFASSVEKTFVDLDTRRADTLEGNKEASYDNYDRAASQSQSAEGRVAAALDNARPYQLSKDRYGVDTAPDPAAQARGVVGRMIGEMPRLQE